MSFINLNTKYKIGDKVKKYDSVGSYTDKVICPLCSGKHTIEFQDDYLECGCCDENGYIYIPINYKTERVLNNTIYEITGISIYITTDKVAYRYSIDSSPKLGSKVYISSSAMEEDLELVE